MDFLIEPIFYNWLILGAVLLIIEVASFTLLFLWLSIAAFIMGGISYIFPNLSISTQLIIFAAISLLSVIIWHKAFKKAQDNMGDARMNNRAERYIGRTATLTEAVHNGRGKIQIEDSLWRVHCDSELPSGTQVEIIGAEGVLLLVKPYLPKT